MSRFARACLTTTMPAVMALGCAHTGGRGLVEPDQVNQGQPGGTLIVRISGVDSPKGTVRVGLFDKAEGFPTESGLLMGRRIPASGAVDDEVEAIFEDAPQGRYALVAYQDLNDNEQLDEGSFGIPTEPYGFSRNVLGHFGPPEFEEAAFNHGTREQRVPMHLGGIRVAPH